jgi:hypothetical protein
MKRRLMINSLCKKLKAKEEGRKVDKEFQDKYTVQSKPIN